ncbi:glycosyltransferase [Bordetella sp. FB-8]|uniref:glycosyltransferase family 2 protein n=1 Tax=Bordetella sp. FB-8 TaxID=1159870 RepID=UPI0003A2A355
MMPLSRKATAVMALLSAFPMLAFAQSQIVQAAPSLGNPLPIRMMTWLLAAIVLLLVIFATRHYVFTLARLFGRQRQPYLDIEMGNWPDVVIFVAAHNEEQVISDSLTALLEVDYPHEKLIIMPVNDRSSDKTRTIIDRIAAANPGRLHPFHRDQGRPGKAAALKDATAMINVEVIVIFDADYLPARGLIKQLVAPLFDPEVGAVMGRVVPLNVGHNLLTRLLDLERAGGYQVDQAARMNLGLVPQYGGTVGAVRQRALNEVGGWDIDMLAEDTDITFRLLQNGWKTVYQNRSECYEEVPQTWRMRIGQISRWSRGHNQVLMKNLIRLVLNGDLRFRERLDGALLLGVFMMSPVLILGWMLATALFFISPQYWVLGWLAFSALLAYGALGTNAAFFEIAAATYLDGNRNRIRLLPFSMLGFLISMVTISKAALSQLVDYLRRKELTWHKTERFRRVTIETRAADVETVALKPDSDMDVTATSETRKP